MADKVRGLGSEGILRIPSLRASTCIGQMTSAGLELSNPQLNFGDDLFDTGSFVGRDKQGSPSLRQPKHLVQQFVKRHDPEGFIQGLRQGCRIQIPKAKRTPCTTRHGRNILMKSFVTHDDKKVF